MPPTRKPGTLGANPGAAKGEAPRAHRPGPVGGGVRFPTLEVFAAMHGNAFATGGFPLSPRQLELAKPIFGESLRYEEIRIVIASFANAPTTLGPYVRIALPEGIDDPLITDRTLIHELTHVWQYQNRGMKYVSNSLCQQVAGYIATGSRNEAYRLPRSEVVAAGSFDRLHAEKMATLVEYWFADDDFDSEKGNPSAARTAVRDEPVAKAMLDEVRAARPLTKKQILEEAAWGAGQNTRRILDVGSPEAPGIPLIRIEF